RTRKETIKATYSAAEAQTRINEAFTGISEEMNDVGLAIQRAEDKTLQLQARASAVDELLASGALEDPTGTVRDDITRELDMLAADSSIENELAAMKAQLAGGPAARPELQAAPEAPAGGEGQA
ncbi:MAG TPA: PspA/IM30 family protein, partial [Arachnia sp.]|nr:PspA/IM30 family protein [Arachnia sp.]